MGFLHAGLFYVEALRSPFSGDVTRLLHCYGYSFLMRHSLVVKLPDVLTNNFGAFALFKRHLGLLCLLAGSGQG